MQLFDLDGDMLAEILTVCNKSSLLALSRTSSFGNILATPYLLRSVQLGRDRDQVISFLRYIITGSQGYDRTLNMPGIHIQTLQICYPAFFPRNTMPADRCQFVPNVSWASGLTRAIALMPNIRTIEIEHSVESLFENSRSFVHTLMMSPHLRHIKLRGVASFACELLGEAFEARDSLVPLQTLAVCALPFFGRGLMVLVSGEGIGKVLFQARDSLTEVCLKAFNLWNFTCPPAADPQHPGHNLDGPALPIQFPRVKTLYLDQCAIPYSALSYSFPEVRILTISNSLSRISYARPTSPCSSPALLPKLSSLNAPDFDVLKFLQLGGTYINLCRLVIIDRPGLTPILFPYSTDDLLTMLLAAPNLRSLHFSPPNHFTASDIEDMQWWHNFIKHVSHLTFLHFSVFTRLQQGFEQMCHDVPAMLSALPLQYLSLNISLPPLPPPGLWEPVSEDLEYPPVLTDASIALSYARSISSLKYLRVTQGGGTNTWWRVNAKPNGLSAQEREESVYVREIDKEDGVNAEEYFDWNW